MSASRSQSDQKLVALVERIKESVPADTSIAELAESTGIKLSFIERILSGERGVSTSELRAISEYLNVDPYWLVHGVEDPHKYSMYSCSGAASQGD